MFIYYIFIIDFKLNYEGIEHFLSYIRCTQFYFCVASFDIFSTAIAWILRLSRQGYQVASFERSRAV